MKNKDNLIFRCTVNYQMDYTFIYGEGLFGK